MSRPRRIGILGGMGPEATVLLMRRIIDAVPAEDDSGHIPLIVDNNTQVPSRIRVLIEGTGEDPGPVLAGMARTLERAGAEALAMPCNTAHHYANAIRHAAAIPFLDMIELSADDALRAAGPGATVGVLGSPALRKIGIFDQALAARRLTAAYPADQDGLLAAIRSIKKEGGTAKSRAALETASASLMDAGARVQLVACTEFSIIADAVTDGVTTIDTLDVLVREIVRFATGSAGEVPVYQQAG